MDTNDSQPATETTDNQTDVPKNDAWEEKAPMNSSWDATTPPPPEPTTEAQESSQDPSSSDPAYGKTLFISNLSKRTTSTTLESLFSKYGDVASISIPLDPHTQASRGFAFVTFGSVAAAEMAQQGLEGVTVDERVIGVEVAKRARPRTPTPGMYQGVRRNASRREGGYRQDRHEGDRYQAGSRYAPYHRERREDRYVPSRESPRRRRSPPPYSRGGYHEDDRDVYSRRDRYGAPQPRYDDAPGRREYPPPPREDFYRGVGGGGGMEQPRYGNGAPPRSDSYGGTWDERRDPGMPPPPQRPSLYDRR